MGYRSEQKWEDAEEARYRAEVPLRTQMLSAARAWAFIAAVIGMTAFCLWWKSKP